MRNEKSVRGKNPEALISSPESFEILPESNA